MASALTLDLVISGTIGKFVVEPLTAQYQVSGQDAATGPKEVLVPAAAAPASVSVCLEAMSAQNLLLICSDSDVTYQLNADGTNRTINAGGFAIHPGDPVVSELAFGGNGSDDANVTIFQLGIPGLPPSGIGGAVVPEELAPATPSQPIFNLTNTPANPLRVLFFRDGALQSFSDYSVAGNVLTWTGAAFTGGERVQVVF
jgi:hypothetical protein